ncbi:unnamed protein product [Ectocarpus sp. CCAP 1310/34]|nr:unnamed protein product [Ectocarpus sp. CCAP 1310/34]
MQFKSIGGNWYTLIIRDDCTRWTRVFFLKHKSDAAAAFEPYLADYRAETVPCEVFVARTDGGGEFQGQFAEVCRRYGIKQEFTPPNTPKYNGVAERALGLLADSALASRIQAKEMFPDAPVSPGLWAEAISCACHQMNCTATTGNPGHKSPYELFHAIGCLMWLLFTRPDIALPLNKLQKIAHSPTERMWNALVRIMSYLNETKDLGITYVRGSGLDLDVFVDSSYADSTVDRRSTTGLAVTVGGTVVCASTKTQPVTAQSTTEAEYIAAGEGLKEALRG